SALPVAPQWSGCRERGGIDSDGAAESNDGDGAAPNHRPERRDVHAHPPGRLAHREEQGRVLREASPVHGLSARRLKSSPSTTRPTRSHTTSLSVRQTMFCPSPTVPNGGKCNGKASHGGARRKDCQPDGRRVMVRIWPLCFRAGRRVARPSRKPPVG